MEWVLARDAEELIEARSFQEEGVLERAGVTREQAERAAWLITPEGERLAGARAAAGALRLLPGWRWAGWLMTLPVLSWLASIAYRWIADHRSFVSRVTGVHSSASDSGPRC